METFPTSLYYNINEICAELQPLKDEFIIITVNIESLMAKIDKLKELIAIFQSHDIIISAIALQETWLRDDADINYLKIPGYHDPVHQGRICGQKGGLLTYVHGQYLPPVKRESIYKECKDWEALIVDVNYEFFSSKVTICNFYRPPRDNYSNASLDKFLKPFKPILKTLSKENSVLIVCGDANINLLRLDTWTKCQEYFDLLTTQNVFPCITLPTRFSKHRATLIDHIFCRGKTDMHLLKSAIIINKISDHLPCLAVISTKKNKRKVPKYIEVQTNSKEAIDKFKSQLSREIANTNFDHDILANPNSNYDKLHDILISCKAENLPTKKIRFNRKKHKIAPWMTYGILESINKRDELQAKLLKLNPRSPNYEELEMKLKRYTSVLQTCRRRAKADFYKKDFEKRKDSIRDTWKGINNILNRKNNNSQFPTHLVVDGKVISDDEEIAEAFNDFFINIGPTLSNAIKVPQNKSYKDYIKEKIHATFNFETVNIDKVTKIIDKMKPKTSSGQDGISSALLKDINHITVNIITLIINQSLLTGICPDRLKIAKVVPIFKKDNPHITGNYRPISLLPVISKVLEKVVFDQLYNYLDKNNLLYKSQYGFRKGHSCELAAMEVTDKIFNELDKKKLPIAIFLDFSKAFDTINHDILIDKLKHYGVTGVALKWFRDYLTNRKQFVLYKNKLSNESTITTGVPQGSILGPLLFIVYINDIAKITNKFKFTIYADDTTLIEPICTFAQPTRTNKNALSKEINSELEKIVQWLALNKLSLNAKKTKFMIFHYKQKKINDIIPKLIINKVAIERVDEFNFLGLIIDEHMTFKSHANKIAAKIACTIGTMKRLKHFLPTSILRTLYNSLILPHLTYGIILWGKELKRINKLQKWALRTIVNAKYNEHTEPILKRLKLLKAADIYRLAAVKIVHKYRNNKLPLYFNGMFDYIQPTHSHNTRRRNERRDTPTSISAAQSPRYSIPNVFDQTDVSITSKVTSISIQSVSKLMKNYIINSYNEHCTITNCYICTPIVANSNLQVSGSHEF